MPVRFALAKYDLLECPSCGFRCIPYLVADSEDEAPSPSEEQIRVHQAYAISHLESNRDRVTATSDLLQSAANRGRVLDVGCGAGGFLTSLPDGFCGVGIETSPIWREISRRNGVEVFGEPIEAPIWAKRGPFSAITLWDVIEHVNDPGAVVRRCGELLAPDGVLLMDTPNRDGLLYQVGDVTTKLSRGRYPTTLGIQYSPTPFDHKQIFRVRDMMAMLQAVGFDSINIETKFELSLPPAYYVRAIVKNRAAANLLAAVASVALRVLPVNNKMIVVARSQRQQGGGIDL